MGNFIDEVAGLTRGIESMSIISNSEVFISAAGLELRRL